MKHTFLFIATVLCVCIGCDSENQEYVNRELARSNQALDSVREKYNRCISNATSESIYQLEEAATSSDLDVSAGSLDLSQKERTALATQQHLVDSVRMQALEMCKEYVRENYKVLVDDESLIEGVKAYPLYLQKGSKIIMNHSIPDQASAKWYNADSRKLLKTWESGTGSDTLVIPNSAVYLYEVSCNSPDYGSIEILQEVHSIQEFRNTQTISVAQVEASANDFRARCVPGIDMKPIFEEPHKMTVRSKLKYWMDTSSPYRTVAAIKMPSNSSDLLYHLRISTDDDGKANDGKFCEDVYTKYRKIKFLGLPLYESTKSRNSIFKELLSGLFVQREEKAYCNLYVFTNETQARHFQENADINKLSYNMDYSLMGTQSINERIPVKGNNTIYLGIENTRQRYDLYLWLEAIAAVPRDIYYTEKFTVIQK